MTQLGRAEELGSGITNVTKYLPFLGGITVNGVKYHLDKMKKQKIIRRVGSDKGGHWEILNKDVSTKS